MQAGVASAILGGESVELLAERAIHWPGGRTLFVADVHLGKAAAFRAGGVPIPRGATATDLARLDALIERTAARRLVVLGDFLHAAAGRVPALHAAFAQWRAAHAALSITLVRGNHDERAGDPPPAWGIDVVPIRTRWRRSCCATSHRRRAPAMRCAVTCTRACASPSERTSPSVCRALSSGDGAPSSPAFGRLTGLALVEPAAGETVVAIADSRLFALPRRP